LKVHLIFRKGTFPEMARNYSLVRIRAGRLGALPQAMIGWAFDPENCPEKSAMLFGYGFF
jgi:hypothetical protein